MENCQKENTLLQPDSHVNHIQSPERKKRPKTSAIFGLSVGECYASYDPEHQYLKTLQDYLIPMEGDSLTESCLTFSAAGMMRNGKLYRLRRSVRHILESVFGLSVTQMIRGGGSLLAYS
jgi:hypothetical protein